MRWLFGPVVRPMRREHAAQPSSIQVPSRVAALGAGALFALFLMPHPTYRNLPQLFADRAAASTSAGTSQGSKPPSDQQTEPRPRPLAVRVAALERPGISNGVSDSGQVLLMRERIGTNILAASGYLESAEVTIERTGPPPPHIIHVLRPTIEAQSCATDTGHEDTDTSALAESQARAANRERDELRARAAGLSLAVVAVEKLHRNALHRAVEWQVARLHAAVLGTLPDFSYGPAQLRLSTLRRTAVDAEGEPVLKALASQSDTEIVARLRDECLALGLVTAIMMQMLAGADKENCEEDDCPSPETRAAAAYAGQRRRSFAAIDYGPVVAVMAGMLER